MKNFYAYCVVICSALALYYVTTTSCKQKKSVTAGMIRKIKSNEKEPESAPRLGILQAHDGISLAYACYVPEKPQAALIFYHGSGAHGCAGYTYMAEQLCNNYHIATYLFDIRGHGKSGGPRGDAPQVTDVWHDVIVALRHVTDMHSPLPIFLGGHSGGAGMLINYASWDKSISPEGYIFVAPMLGKDAHVARERKQKNKRPFVQLNTFAFLVHRLTGGLIGGRWHAVQFDYPNSLVEQHGFVKDYTMNMVQALHPKTPYESLLTIDVPAQIIIADQDELFDPHKMDRFLDPIVALNKNITVAHVPEAFHLTILGQVHDVVGKAFSLLI